MTTGNVAHGTSVSIWCTNVGTGYRRENFGNKVWNGADSSAASIRSAGPLRLTQRKTYQAWFGRYRGTQTWECPPSLRGSLRTPRRGARLPDHPYTMTDTQLFDDKAWNWNRTAEYTGVLHGAGVGGVNYNWSSNDDLNLLGKLREKTAGSDFNFGVFLGEMGEAMGMIGNAATRVANAYRYARRGNFSAAAASLSSLRRDPSGRRIVARNWLELQYGWLPLLNDAEAGAKFLAHHLNVPLEQVVRVRRRRAGYITPANGTVRWNGMKCFQSKQIIARLKEKDVYKLSGLTDPMSVAWELVPYSFVIDWFLPIGDYLSARGLASALTGTFVTSTMKYYDTGVGFRQWVNPAQVSTHNVFRQTRVEVTREVSTTLNVPLPSVKGLGEAMSWKRAANAVSLVLSSR